MSEVSVAVLYHSRLGHTEVIAECVGEGAGAEAEARIAIATRRRMEEKAG